MRSAGELSDPDIDAIIGRRMKEARIQKGLTGAELGLFLDISAQQVSKFERGQNKVRASQLWSASFRLGRSIDWFFEISPCSGRLRNSARRQHDFIEVVSTLELPQLRMIASMARSLAAGTSAPIGARGIDSARTNANSTPAGIETGAATRTVVNGRKTRF